MHLPSGSRMLNWHLHLYVHVFLATVVTAQRQSVILGKYLIVIVQMCLCWLYSCEQICRTKWFNPLLSPAWLDATPTTAGQPCNCTIFSINSTMHFYNYTTPLFQLQKSTPNSFPDLIKSATLLGHNVSTGNLWGLSYKQCSFTLRGQWIAIATDFVKRV